MSVADRQSLFESASTLGIADSVRVWLAAGATFPYAKKTTAPFTYDLAGGPWSFYSTRSTQLLDASGNPIVGGQLNIGNRRQFVSDWEPWAQSGFTFLYDILPFYDFADFGVFPDPHTGLYIPIRSTFDVTTAGPTGTLPVPATAYWFNASQVAPTVFSNTWQTVGSGVTATSKVVFNYTFGPWHDGAPMDMSDVLYALALNARRNYGDIFAKDPLASAFPGQLLNQTFKGLEVIDSTHLAIYLNYWHVDPTVIAATADGPGLTFPSTSWDESELAMATVLHGNTVVSTTTANLQGTTSLDLTKGATIGFMDRELNAKPVRDQRRRRHGAVDGPRQPSCGLPFGVWDVLLEQRAVLHPPDRHDGENNRVQQLRDRERRARRLPVPCRPLCEPDRSEGSGDCARGPIPDSDGPASHLQPDDHLAGGALRRRELVVPCAQPGHALSGPVGHADTDRRGEVGDRLERCADRRAFARGIHNSNNYCGCRSCGAVLLDGLVHGDFAAGILPGSVRAGVGRSEQPHFQPAE